MSWVKIEDEFATHRKMRDAGMEATCLWVAGLAFCSRYRTNGFVTRDDLTAMWPWATFEHLLGLAEALVSVGLWDPSMTETDGWVVHDYLEYQPSREEQESKRAAALRRAKAYRTREAERRDGVMRDERVRHEDRKRAHTGRERDLYGQRGESAERGEEDRHEKSARPYSGRFTPDEARVWGAFGAMCDAIGRERPVQTKLHVKRMQSALKRHDAAELVAMLEEFPAHADHQFRDGENWFTNATPDILFREHNLERMAAWLSNGKKRDALPDDLTPEARAFAKLG